MTALVDCRFCLVVAVGLVGVLAACSSSEPAAEGDEVEGAKAARGPTFSLLYTTEDGVLTLRDAERGNAKSLSDGVRRVGRRAVSPSGRRLAFSYTGSDSTRLALLDRADGTLRPVHARPGSVTYSLAWHPSDDRLAFAYYEPVDQGTRGPGSVYVASSDGTYRSVGCSAAREVLAWLSDGELATRNDDKLYVVDPSDCATRASADARRMHEASYAPTGSRLAYIHRELSYDRDAGEYRPDSSLYLSDARGANTTEILGPKRQPRHLRWRPDGTELAADVHVADSGQRQIVVYRSDADRTVFLTDPASTSADQLHPRWSPDGTHVAFTMRRGETATAAVRVQGQTRTLGSVETAVWGWIDDRTVVVPGPDSLHIQTLNGETRHAQAAPASLLDVWSQDPA